MNKILMVALAAAAFSPVTATAQGFEFAGAELSYDYRESDDDYYTSGLRASAEALIVGQITAQLDIFSNRTDGDVIYDGYALHAGYTVVPNTVVGVFYGLESWDLAEFQTIGVEANYTAGPLLVEGFYGVVTDIAGGNYEDVIVRVDVDYDVMPRLSVVGDMTDVSGTGDWQIIGVGARYDIFQGVYAEANLHNITGNSDENVFGIEFGYRFGGGTTFGARDWNGMLTSNYNIFF